MNKILTPQNRQIFFFIVLAYAFSVLCRLDWVLWASGFDEFIYNGKIIINTNDGYAFGEGARDMLAGFHQEGDLSYYGAPLSTLAYLIVKFTPFSLEGVMLYLSAVLSSLIVIPLILIAKTLGAPRAGLCAALLASIAHSYYNRTMVGYFDTDMLNIVLACFIIWGLVRLNAYKDTISALIASLSMLIYFWWYSSSFTLNAALIAMFLLYTLIWHKKEKIYYLTMILMLLAITSIAIWFKILLFALILFLYKSKFYQLSNKQNAIIIALGALIFAIFALSGGLNPIWFQLKFYLLRSTPEKETLNFIFFNVNQTISESSIIPFGLFSERISSALGVFVLSFVGYILAIFRHKILLLSLPMCALGFLALFSGLRFTIYAVPFMAFGFGFLLEILGSMLNERIKQKSLFLLIFIFISFIPILYLQSKFGLNIEFWLCFGLFLLVLVFMIFNFSKDLGAQLMFVGCIFALTPSLVHIYSYKAQSVFFKNEVSVLDSLKSIADREDYALAWWDYGYPIRFYSDVKTLIDGGKHLGSDNFAVSFALIKPQRPSANIARLEVEYTQKNLHENFGLNLAKIMKDYNASDVNEFLLSLNDENFALPKKTRDIFYVLPDRMHYIIPTISRFSQIDLKTGKSYANSLFMVHQNASQSKRGIELEGGMYLDKTLSQLNINGKNLPVNTFINTEYKDGKLSVEYSKFDERGLIFVIYMSDYGRILVMDKTMFESTFVQLFVLENYDKNLFEPVIVKPEIKIYKLKV